MVHFASMGAVDIYVTEPGLDLELGDQRSAVSDPAGAFAALFAEELGAVIQIRTADLDAVMETARDEGKILELNANPQRLDLNDVHCAKAKASFERGLALTTPTLTVAVMPSSSLSGTILNNS